MNKFIVIKHSTFNTIYMASTQEQATAFAETKAANSTDSFLVAKLLTESSSQTVTTKDVV